MVLFKASRRVVSTSLSAIKSGSVSGSFLDFSLLFWGFHLLDQDRCFRSCIGGGNRCLEFEDAGGIRVSDTTESTVVGLLLRQNRSDCITPFSFPFPVACSCCYPIISLCCTGYGSTLVSSVCNPVGAPLPYHHGSAVDAAGKYQQYAYLTSS